MLEGPIDVNVSFDVIDETDEWIVVNKPAPLVVHPTSGKVEPTLLGGVEELLRYDLVNGARLSIINRLDRETSGVVLIAKFKTAARAFSRAMERRLIRKEYEAICYGWPDWDEVTTREPILRKGEVLSSPIWVKQMVHPDGKECETTFRVMSRFEREGKPYSLIKAQPKTGRMHQIRVHISHLGYPLVGDKIYGVDESCYLKFIETGWTQKLEDKLKLRRHALHASRMLLDIDGLKFDWTAPMSNELIEFLK